MTQLPPPSPLLRKLPYMADGLQYFHTIDAKLPTALILQSDLPDMQDTTGHKMQGRYDIITGAPEYWLEISNGQTAWHGAVPGELQSLQGTHFAVLRQWLDHLLAMPADYSQCIVEDIPFCGGILGYCSYDLAHEPRKPNSNRSPDISIPDMQFGFYSWAIIQDHLRKVSWLLIHPDCKKETRNSLDSIEISEFEYEIKSSKNKITRPISNISHKEYAVSFSKIKNYIENGDCYQINFSQRFSASLEAEAKSLYYYFRDVMPSPYSAFLPILGQNKNDAIISLSPERFIQMDSGNRVITQPIKGTAARGDTPQADINIASALQRDTKNRAENLMIVDLLRNDLGKVCEIGSIGVSNLFEIQTFSNVHHLVSTIHGKLRNECNAADLFHACFPGGSITGAPKKRAMEIIEEMEPTGRSIYCGSIAYFSSHGSMDSSIIIRTILMNEGIMYCWGGSGIVSDSDCDEEYNESITKIQVLLDAVTKLNG